MIAFDYFSPTEYVFGPDAENRAGELTASKLGKRVLIVYGKGSAERSGLLSRVRRSLTESGIEFEELGGVEPNPTDRLVYRGIDLCRQKKISGLLAVGGGSAIDTAKAIAGGVPYAGDFWDFWAGKAVMTEALPVGVILTIAAAGSEGSGNSVITKTEGEIKISLRTTILRPKFALLNPALTETLPPFQTACGITDMMAHIMERYFSNTTDCEVTDRMCEGLLTAIIAEAPKVMSEPENYQARANIMWAGTLAHNGICGTGRQEEWTCHAIEHEISALYGVAHGAGLAIVFPAWMEYVSQFNSAKIIQFGMRIFNVDSAPEAIAHLRGFYRSIGMPLNFHELGVDSPDICLMNEKLHRAKGAVIGTYVPLDNVATSKIYELMSLS